MCSISVEPMPSRIVAAEARGEALADLARQRLARGEQRRSATSSRAGSSGDASIAA